MRGRLNLFLVIDASARWSYLEGAARRTAHAERPRTAAEGEVLSRIGGIFDGIVDGVRSVLGIEDDNAARPADAKARPAGTPGHGNRRVDTKFDRGPAARSAPGGTGAKAPAPNLDISTSLLDAALASAGLQPVNRADPSSTAGTDLANVRVFDASRPQADAAAGLIGDTKSLANSTDDAGIAARNVQIGLDYFARTFGRSGLDGRGKGVDVVINDRSLDEDGEEMFRGNGGFFRVKTADGSDSAALRFGVGAAFTTTDGRRANQRPMFAADDLTIHELTHGLIEQETGTLGGSSDELGAVNEALADVIAAAATRDWRIGEALYHRDSKVKLMRNIVDADDATALHPLYKSIAQVQAAKASGQLEEHAASGVLSTALSRVQQRVGGEQGWQAVEQLTYSTIISGQLGTMSFTETAAALRAQAGTLWGAGDPRSQIVDTELRRAGL